MRLDIGHSKTALRCRVKRGSETGRLSDPTEKQMKAHAMSKRTNRAASIARGKSVFAPIDVTLVNRLIKNIQSRLIVDAQATSQCSAHEQPRHVPTLSEVLGKRN